jgi:hypothetical protein
MPRLKSFFRIRKKPYLRFGKNKNGLLISRRERPTLKPPKKKMQRKHLNSDSETGPNSGLCQLVKVATP